MSYRQELIHFSLLSVLALSVLSAGELRAGYLISAHGSWESGVARPAMTDYATGNCAHCHEMHASLAGSEPAPVGGAPSPYTLFATNFNSNALPGSYLVTDNFCFSCHSGGVTVQRVVNADYSTTFGGGTAGTLPQYIMEAFNQGSLSTGSFHGLADIHTFMTTGAGAAMAPWYTSFSNPCNACHNPHLARKNFGSISVFTAPLASAISKPSAHFSLWGVTETMAAYSGYEAPYANAGTAAREPDGTVVTAGGDSSGQAAKIPDYVGFCTDCHNDSNKGISSTTLGTLKPIDWLSIDGEKHGSRPRDGSDNFKPPYSIAGKTNMVLSCLDCHEPHGSSSIMLIRRRVNGATVDSVTSLTANTTMKNLCGTCHTTNWKAIHHDNSGAPYSSASQCLSCHGGQPTSNPIPCGNCHFHGSNDSWVATRGLTPTYRTTF